jgi:hypothetical protein
MKTKLTDPPTNMPVEFADLVSKIMDREAELVKQAEAGLLLPWQEEELVIVSDLLRNIRQSWRGSPNSSAGSD